MSRSWARVPASPGGRCTLGRSMLRGTNRRRDCSGMASSRSPSVRLEWGRVADSASFTVTTYRSDPCQADLIHPGYRMGAVPVPINYRLTPVEIADILDGISPRLLAVEDPWANLAAELAFRGRREPLLWIGSDHGSRAGEPDLRDTARRFGREARKRSGRRCAHRALPATYRRLQGAAPIPLHRGHADERDGEDPQVRSPPPGHVRG